MSGGSIQGQAGGPGSSPPSWRDDALRSMLSVAAVVAPVTSILAIVARPAS